MLVGPTVDAQARALGRQILRLARDAFQEPARLVGIAAWDYAVYGPLRLMRTARSVVDDAIEVHAPNVRAPTLVVRGEHDPLVPQEWAEELVALLPDARLEVVAGAPHAVNYTAADQLAALTLDFLNDPERRPERLTAPQHGLVQVAVPLDRASASRMPKSRGRTSSVSSSQRSGVETGAPGFGRTE